MAESRIKKASKAKRARTIAGSEKMRMKATRTRAEEDETGGSFSRGKVTVNPDRTTVAQMLTESWSERSRGMAIIREATNSRRTDREKIARGVQHIQLSEDLVAEILKRGGKLSSKEEEERARARKLVEKVTARKVKLGTAVKFIRGLRNRPISPPPNRSTPSLPTLPPHPSDDRLSPEDSSTSASTEAVEVFKAADDEPTAAERIKDVLIEWAKEDGPASMTTTSIEGADLPEPLDKLPADSPWGWIETIENESPFNKRYGRERQVAGGVTIEDFTHRYELSVKQVETLISNHRLISIVVNPAPYGYISDEFVTPSRAKELLGAPVSILRLPLFQFDEAGDPRLHVLELNPLRSTDRWNWETYCRFLNLPNDELTWEGASYTPIEWMETFDDVDKVAELLDQETG